VDRGAGEGDRSVLTVDGVVRLDDAFLERRGRQDRLEGRAGLEGIGHGTVAPVVRRRHVEEGIRVERRADRHGEDVAGARLEHDRHRRLRVGPPVGGVDLALGDVLDRAVDRQRDAVAGLWRLEQVRRGHLAAERIPSGDRLARPARELRVESPLDPLEPALGALEADDVRGQLAVGIEPERLRQKAEPRLAERPHLLGHRGRELAAEPHEGPGACQGGVHLPLGQAEDRRQPGGDAHRIADASGLDEQRLGRGRCGERGAAAVEDGPAQRRKHDGAGILALGERRQLPVLDDHQPTKPSREAAEREREDGREQQHPRADGCVPHWAGGLVTGKDAARRPAAARPVPPATYSFASRI
jgi:hypothetical protein